MTHELVERLRKPWDGTPGSRKRRDEERTEAADKLQAYMAEIADLRAEKDEIRKAVIEKAASLAENATISVQHDWAPGPVTMPIDHRKNIAAAIRNMGERE